jgi:hypothetical protein
VLFQKSQSKWSNNPKVNADEKGVKKIQGCGFLQPCINDSVTPWQTRDSPEALPKFLPSFKTMLAVLAQNTIIAVQKSL